MGFISFAYSWQDNGYWIIPSVLLYPEHICKYARLQFILNNSSKLENLCGLGMHKDIKECLPLWTGHHFVVGFWRAHEHSLLSENMLQCQLFYAVQ